MRIADSKALARGGVFLALGLFAIVVGHRYPLGSLTRMGPGYFPMLVSVLMIALALANIAMGIGRHGEPGPAPRFALLPLALITAGVVVFALLIERAGLLAAVLALLLLVCFAGGRRGWRELLVILLLMGAISSALFVFGLGMPIAYLFGR